MTQLFNFGPVQKNIPPWRNDLIFTKGAQSQDWVRRCFLLILRMYASLWTYTLVFLLVNYMGAAADCTYTAAYQGIQNARIQMINDWNTASTVYERTFNVSLGIIQLYMMTPVCPTTISRNITWNQNCSSSYTINSRLSDFSIWRGARGEDGAGLWHLMTQCL